MGFPAVSGRRRHLGSSLFSHLSLQKPPDFPNFGRRQERGTVSAFRFCGGDAYFNPRFYPGWNRAGQINKYPLISRNVNNLFYGHRYNIPINPTKKQGEKTRKKSGGKAREIK
jgi:hypothetical protein